MIEQYAIVMGLEQNLARLEIERRTACSLCGQKRGCGNAVWGKLLGHQSHTFLAENKINASVGDSVVVGVDERAALRSVYYLYVLPLLSMLVFAVVADFYTDNQLHVLLATMLGLVLGFLWVKGHLVGFGHHKKTLSNHQAVILRFADAAPQCASS
ncbi:MAG: Fis family transcriptional regulator [Betaproteobacteria bacterium HGW-Betaproteobacteria-22]|nr:MAG: Fis family transcriptional regulator [Betaproteobacteria bacterium HGW-Betaproteobacteria-22]